LDVVSDVALYGLVAKESDSLAWNHPRAPRQGPLIEPQGAVCLQGLEEAVQGAPVQVAIHPLHAGLYHIN
jgi:hypothetical protein